MDGIEIDGVQLILILSSHSIFAVHRIILWESKVCGQNSHQVEDRLAIVFKRDFFCT